MSAGKNIDIPNAPCGTNIPLKGKLYDMLNAIFIRSESECKIPIYFRPTESGVQSNDCRNEIVALLKRSNTGNACKLAVRLMKCTTNKSGLGLLFFIVGIEKQKHKIMISRFPAEEGIMANENSKTLSVEFIERVFMKNAYSYKSAIFSGTSFDAHFWEGAAIDRQIASSMKELSNYWIRDFLLSDFKTTPKEGTKRLALALKAALKQVEDIRDKEELISAAVLASNLQNRPTSINGFCTRFHLSDNVKNIIVQQLGKESLANANFVFDSEEFARYALFKSVELDNGSTLIAQTDKFDTCFNTEIIDKNKLRYRFSTEGNLVNAKLRSRN